MATWLDQRLRRPDREHGLDIERKLLAIAETFTLRMIEMKIGTADLARRSRVSSSTIRRVMSCGRGVRVETLLAIAAALNCDLRIGVA